MIREFGSGTFRLPRGHCRADLDENDCLYGGAAVFYPEPPLLWIWDEDGNQMFVTFDVNSNRVRAVIHHASDNLPTTPSRVDSLISKALFELRQRPTEDLKQTSSGQWIRKYPKVRERQ